MKKRNQKFNALRLNKVKVSHMVLGGLTDTAAYCEDDEVRTSYCHTTAGSAKTASKAVTRYC